MWIEPQTFVVFLMLQVLVLVVLLVIWTDIPSSSWQDMFVHLDVRIDQFHWFSTGNWPLPSHFPKV